MMNNERMFCVQVSTSRKGEQPKEGIWRGACSQKQAEKDLFQLRRAGFKSEELKILPILDRPRVSEVRVIERVVPVRQQDNNESYLKRAQEKSSTARNIAIGAGIGASVVIGGYFLYKKFAK